MPSFPFGMESRPEAPMDTVDHATAAVGRIATYLRGKAGFEALVRAFAAEVQVLEAAFQTLRTVRSMSGVGVQLDAIGTIIGQSRQGMDDESYAGWLKARGLLNRSSGAAEEILELFRLVVSSDTTLALNRYFPAAFVLRLYGAAQPGDIGALFPPLLRAAKAAGVRAVIEGFICDPSEVFTLDVGPGLDVGKLAAAME